MNNLILMSIKTKYADEIFNGNKKYEYRKSSIDENNLNKKIFIYSAGISKSIIGYLTIDNILVGNIDYIVEKTKPNESNIKEYFKNSKNCYALHINKVHRFSNPITLKELKKLDQNFAIPQYYRYIKPGNKIYNLLITNN